MSRLQVYQNNTLLQEISLKNDVEYTIGRSQSCDVVLGTESGISRQHCQLKFDGNSWCVTLLSKSGEVTHRGQNENEFSLDSDDQFSIQSYDFKLVSAAENSLHTGSFSDVSERTVVGTFASVAFLKVYTEKGEPLQTFQLEGSYWIGGRDTSCAIFIDNPKLSRQHFEISKEAETYSIRDLGSSNKTYLNGAIVESENWSMLHSGDVITIASLKLNFEIRDQNFSRKLEMVKIEAPPYDPYPAEIDPNESHELQESEILKQEIMSSQLHHQIPQEPVTTEDDPEEAEKKNKALFFRFIIIVLILLGGLGYFLQNDNDTPDKPNEVKKAPTPFELLTPEQQQYVKDTYKLAESLFKQGRYALARQEIAKIHELIPSYEDSKNLDHFAQVALETEIEKQQAEVKEKEQQEIEGKIQSQLAVCRQKMKLFNEVSDYTNCMSSVISFNPDHPDINSLRKDVEQMIAQKNDDKAKRKAYLEKVGELRGVYKKAEDIKQEGDDLGAIVAYQKVVDSPLPDPENLKQTSKNRIKNLEAKVAKMQEEYEAKADAAFKRGDLKSTVNELKNGLKVNPDNDMIKSRIDSVLNELRKQMQPIYQEGILDESVGDVEPAKAKWRKILETSVPDEEYYKKAKIKLKKYGAL